MTNSPRNFRIVLAVALLAALSLLSISKRALAVVTGNPLDIGSQPGRLREFLNSDRYAELLQVLPDDVTTVAYIDAHSNASYSWAQYVLVPLLVVDTTDYEYYSGEPQVDFADYDYVIGDFDDPPSDEFLAEAHLMVVQEFDRGVYLLKPVMP